MNIFLSYCQTDFKERDELLENISYLEVSGIVKVWHDKKIKAGTKWEDVLRSNLTNSPCAIVIITPSYLASEYCLQELREILKKPIVYFLMSSEVEFDVHEELRERQIYWPLKGRLKAISRLGQPQKQIYYSELVKDIRRQIESTESILSHVLLTTEEQRASFISKIMDSYKHRDVIRDSSIMELSNAYMALYAASHYQEAQALIDVFKTKAQHAGVVISDSTHVEILKLFSIGIPRKPVNLRNLCSYPVDNLLKCPGYAELMHGIRLTETDGYEIALKYLVSLADKWPHLSKCALLFYSRAQAERKLGGKAVLAGVHDSRTHFLTEAKASLKHARSLTAQFAGETCACGPECRKAILLCEINRALGTVSRALGQPSDAETSFRECLSYLTEEIPDAVRSDCLYSYGYFLLEDSQKRKEQKGELWSQRQLKKAHDQFMASSKLQQT